MVLNTPLRIANSDVNFLDVTEITNSINSKSNATVTEDRLEKMLCHRLINIKSPQDVSTNLIQSDTLTIEGGREKINGIMIANNEDLIDSELFALKLKYTTENVAPVDVSYLYSYGSALDSKVVKKAATDSFQTSKLKISVEFNNDAQDSIDENGNQGDWNIQFDRSRDDQTNYFAALNSNLNTTNGSYPLYITELTNNDYILNDGKYIASIDASNQHIYGDFSSTYKLETHNLTYDICDNHVYQSSDFTMYKLVQPIPTVVLTTTGVASDLPIVTSSGADITSVSFSDFKTNVDSVLGNNINNITDGFKIEVDIGYGSNGGLTVEENNILSIDTTAIKNSDEFVAAGIKTGDDHMYIDITNGSLTLSGTDVSSNTANVSLSSGEENLISPYNTTNGNVKIYVKPTNERTTFVSGNNQGDIAKNINVLYNCVESLAYDSNGCSKLDESMLKNQDVNLKAGIVVPTTDLATRGECFTSYESPQLNFRKSEKSLLTIANNPNYDETRITYNDVSFVSNINTYFEDTKIVYISINNKNILTEETPLRAPGEGNTFKNIPHSLVTVTAENINLDSYPYDDYKIKLYNKTISTDLSNSVQSTNGWYLQSTNGNDYLVSSPIKTSILYDDCLFMRSEMDTSFNYTFNIATPTVTNAQSIKHRIDISYNDIELSNNGIPYLVPKHAYLDDNDISYSTPVIIQTEESTLENNHYTINNNAPQQIDHVSKIIVKKIINTITYNVSFEPKLPFYLNLKLQSPTITEYVEYYALYESDGTRLPDIYLKYLKDTSQNPKSLSLVTVTQPEGSTFSTTLKVTPSGCSTLKAVFYGETAGVLDKVPLSDEPHVDPFFNTQSFIKIGETKTVTLIIQVTYPTILSDQYYIIDTTNKPGEKTSFETNLYLYDTTDHSGTNRSFDNFHPYINSWVTSTTESVWMNGKTNPTEISLTNTVTLETITLDDGSEKIGLTLRLFYGDDEIAKITQPNTLINDFNIIRCVNPLVITYSQINENEWNTSYTTATKKTVTSSDRIIQVADGVYLKTNDTNPEQFSYIEFSLKPDQFSVEFVNNYSAINGTWASQQDFTNIDADITNGLKLTVYSADADHDTRSVTFDKYRGYNRIGSTNGVDTINLVRTGMSALFTVDTSNNGIFTQRFTDFTTDGTYTVSDASNVNGINFDLGLKFNGLLSLLDEDTESDRIYIDVQPASISWRFINPDDESFSSGSSTLTDTSFPDLFGWKPRRILSDEYNLTITYTIPQVQYYTLQDSGANLSGNPVDKTNWSSNPSSITINTETGFNESGIHIYRTQEYVPLGFTAYAVVTPPQMKLNYIRTAAAVSGFPYNPSVSHGTPSVNLQSEYYVTIDNDSSELDDYEVPILNNSNSVTITNTNLHQIQKFKNTNLATKVNYFVLLGNYMTINYYVGDNIPPSSGGVTDPVYPRATIDQLSQNDKILVEKTGTLYNIRYKQFISVGGDTNLNDVYNIYFSISDAFLTPPPNDLIIDLNTSASTSATFYQSAVKLVDSSFILIIDKFESSGINYDALGENLSEVFFVITKHSTCSFVFDGNNLQDIGDSMYNTADESNFDVNDLFRGISENDITFTETNFQTANSGVTLTALSSAGKTNLKNIIFRSLNATNLSRTLYFDAKDIIRVNSLFGLPIYRLTNYGNVRTPAITSYAFNVASPTQLYNTGGNSVMNPNNPNNSNLSYIQRIINTMPNAPR